MALLQENIKIDADTAIIEPIDANLQKQVVVITQGYVALAVKIFDRDFSEIPVKFDLLGLTAGMFLFKNKKPLIRYNPHLLAKYFQESIDSTVPHEVAHYIVHEMYPSKRFKKSVKPHGAEWRFVMEKFEADASITCDFDYTGIPRRKQQRHTYVCSCQEHHLASVTHNRMQKKRWKYLCKVCEHELKFQPEGLLPVFVEEQLDLFL